MLFDLKTIISKSKNTTTSYENKVYFSLAASGLLLFAACKGKTTSTTTGSTVSTKTDTTIKSGTGLPAINPSGATPAWAPGIKPQMQAVIEKLDSYGDKPIATLSATDARKNHTPTDAVMELVKQYKIPMPAFNLDTMGKDIPVTKGSMHLSIFTPKTGGGPFPIIVYYHGGGFVIANIKVYEC